MESSMAGVSYMLPHLFIITILFSKLTPIGQLKEPAQRDLLMNLEWLGFEYMSLLYQSSQGILRNTKVTYHGNTPLSCLSKLNI